MLLSVECYYFILFWSSIDKILVTTDEVVAEYQLIDDEAKTNTTCRKSDIVRSWCENNSLVVNKLYPTILAETYNLDNESVPWDKNITLDLTTDSFKTCLTKRSEISGIHRLESTCSCDTEKGRRSMYENFSLPGSPKLITHKNYNTKCSLRSKIIDESLISSDRSIRSSLTDDFNKLKLNDDGKGKLIEELKKRFQDDDFRNRTNESLISSDRSLDKAMAVVQNRYYFYYIGTSTRSRFRSPIQILLPYTPELESIHQVTGTLMVT